MKEMIKHLKIIFILIVLQFILDMLYVYIYPTVNPIRATLIGASALIILFMPFLTRIIDMKPYMAFLPIYSSALFGALLVQAAFVKSKSPASGIAHIVILIVTYFVIVTYVGYKKKK